MAENQEITEKDESANKQEQIFAKVKLIITDQLGLSEDKITLQSHLVDDLGADSLDQVELVMHIEETFDIDIPDDIAEKILTVEDIVTHIKEAM